MKFKMRKDCDNKCAHGCSKNMELSRVISHGQPMVMILCDKAIKELNAQPLKQNEELIVKAA